MPHYAVLVRPGPLIKSFTLRADEHRTGDGVHDFFRDGRLVHRATAADVLRIEPHDSAKAAREALIAYMRDSAGGTTVRVDEGAAPQPRGRGGTSTAVPIEGIAFQIEER